MASSNSSENRSAPEKKVAVVEFAKQGQVAWVTINRPERANTLTFESFELLAQAWEEVRSDEDIRVAVLTATGTKDFCCGGDLVEYIPKTGQTAEKKLRGPREGLMLDRPILKPIIAAINGRALGGGTEIIQATDIRIASENASFSLPEPKVGIVPGAGSMVRLPRQLPYAHAMYMMLTAKTIDAHTAMRWGLVSEVIAPEKLLERADELAQIVCRNAPLAMRAIKQAAYETYGIGWDEAHALEGRLAREVTQSQDAREGPAAFAEKRTPRFTGS
jgi:enoyl-CoA hydratase